MLAKVVAAGARRRRRWDRCMHACPSTSPSHRPLCYAPDHGISQEEIDRAFSTGIEFLDREKVGAGGLERLDAVGPNGGGSCSTSYCAPGRAWGLVEEPS